MIFEEVKTFTYLELSINLGNAMNIEIRRRTVAGIRCYCGLKKLFISRALV